MTTTVNTSENRTFEGMDLFVALFCFALQSASCIGVALSIALWRNPIAISILCPLGGFAICFLWSMYCNHKVTNRGAWKLSIHGGLKQMKAAYLELKEGFSQDRGWKGLIGGAILASIVMIMAILPVIFTSILVLAAGSIFAMLIRIALLVLGK